MVSITGILLLCRILTDVSLGCLDHFLENEVYDNSWDSLYSILTDPELHDIMIDVGYI